MEIFIFFQHIVIVEDLNREIATLEEVSNNISLIYTDTLEKEMYSRGIYRLRTCFEIKYDIHKGFKGILIEDIIYETLKLFIEGKRKWYKDKFPEFKDQLLSSFDSVISNTINKMNHIESVSLDDNSFSIPDEEKNNYSDYISFCEKELENRLMALNSAVAKEGFSEDDRLSAPPGSAGHPARSADGVRKERNG